LDAAAQLQLDDDAIIFVLQPTSPLRRSNHITSALAVQRESSLGSVVSVVECEHHPLKAVTITDGVVSAAFEQKFLESSRQDLPRMFRPNGAIYAMPLSLIRKTNSLVPAGASAFEMTPDDSIDIDTIADVERAETALRRQA
jgi:CMP-N-acetylneuraminic acid synthetase